MYKEPKNVVGDLACTFPIIHISFIVLPCRLCLCNQCIIYHMPMHANVVLLHANVVLLHAKLYCFMLMLCCFMLMHTMQHKACKQLFAVASYQPTDRVNYAVQKVK